MYRDAQLSFSSAQGVTASAASDNTVYLGGTADIGTGEDLYLVVACVVAMTDGSSDSTVVATLQTETDADFGSATTAYTLDTFTATSAAGTIRVVKLDPAKITEKYLRVYYTVANGNLSTGSFDAFIAKDYHRWIAYADNVTHSS